MIVSILTLIDLKKFGIVLYVKSLRNNIVVGAKNVPKIWYKDNNNKLHRHYVDIFIPSKNLCIEVKSIWTVKKANVFLKQDAGKELGYNYEIWVYDSKGNKIECFK